MLYISESVDLSSEHRNFRWKLRPEGMACTNDIRVAYEFIRTGGGDSIKTLILGDGMYDRKRHSVKMVKDFLKYSPNAASLSVSERGGDWVTKFGRQIETLKWCA